MDFLSYIVPAVSKTLAICSQATLKESQRDASEMILQCPSWPYVGAGFSSSAPCARWPRVSAGILHLPLSILLVMTAEPTSGSLMKTVRWLKTQRLMDDVLTLASTTFTEASTS